MRSLNNPVIYKNASGKTLQDVESSEIRKVNMLAKKEIRKETKKKIFLIQLNLFAAFDKMQAKKANLI